MDKDIRSRVGQLFMLGFPSEMPPPPFLDFLKEERIGGVILFEENCRTHELAKENIRLINSYLGDAPPLIAIDQEGGRVSRLRGAPAEFKDAADYGRRGAIDHYREDYSRAMVLMASLGINLKQLYGQTEASVFITQQPDGEVRSDTVGVPSPGVELKIGDNGEVFYRSPGTFVEYFKNPESTKDTKDPEGWVATGDAGFIEPETGHLRIIDRAKDVGKMADGRLFAPKYVENKLKFYPNILEAVVFGSGREFCTAFVNIDLTAVGNWAERNNIAYASYQELAGHPRVYEMIQNHVEEANRSIAGDEMLSGCQVHRFLILHKELDADDGEMTRTRKVRRRIVEEKFADLLEALYGGKDSVYTETEVTYEDGRKGKIKATLEIRNAVVAGDTGRIAAE